MKGSAFSRKPSHEMRNKSTDAWVKAGIEKTSVSKEKPKRILFDISPELHSQLKSYCASNNTSIKDFLTDLVKKNINI